MTCLMLRYDLPRVQKELGDTVLHTVNETTNLNKSDWLGKYMIN